MGLPISIRKNPPVRVDTVQVDCVDKTALQQVKHLLRAESLDEDNQSDCEKLLNKDAPFPEKLDAFNRLKENLPLYQEKFRHGIRERDGAHVLFLSGTLVADELNAEADVPRPNGDVVCEVVNHESALVVSTVSGSQLTSETDTIKNKPHLNLADFPPELLATIASFLTPTELATFSRVSTLFAETARYAISQRLVARSAAGKAWELFKIPANRKFIRDFFFDRNASSASKLLFNHPDTVKLADCVIGEDGRKNAFALGIFHPATFKAIKNVKLNDILGAMVHQYQKIAVNVAAMTNYKQENPGVHWLRPGNNFAFAVRKGCWTFENLQAFFDTHTYQLDYEIKIVNYLLLGKIFEEHLDGLSDKALLLALNLQQGNAERMSDVLVTLKTASNDQIEFAYRNSVNFLNLSFLKKLGTKRLVQLDNDQMNFLDTCVMVQCRQANPIAEFQPDDLVKLTSNELILYKNYFIHYTAQTNSAVSYENFLKSISSLQPEERARLGRIEQA